MLALRASRSALRGAATAAVRTPAALGARLCSGGSHDDFKPQLKTGGDAAGGDVQSVIDQQVKGKEVMLYMKGTPQQPMCGFSQQVVRVLHAEGVDFFSCNVLEHPEIREGIKEYTGWPTIPQLFVEGEFVGGCDIVTQMHQSGDLAGLLPSSSSD